MKKALALILALVMVLAMIPAAFAVNSYYKPGNIIERPSQQNLNGPFGDAYAAAGYQATFTYIEDGETEIDHVEMWGDFQWFSPQSVAEFEAKFKAEDYNRRDPSSYVTGYSAYQYEEGYIATGYGAPLPRVNAEDNANGEIYGKAGLYSTPGDAGYIYYPLTEVDEGVWQLTMPVPAGQYRYAYKLYFTDGTTQQIQDPAEDVDWYELETMLANTAYWSYILVGTAEESAQNQYIIYPSVADEYKGRVVADELVSAATATNGGVKQKIQVYLPYNYDESREDYKLVIVSHGNTENETVYMTFGRVPDIMDNMIAAGEVSTDVIVVAVDNGLTFQGTRFGNQQLVAQNYVEYLIPYMAENYGTSTNPEDIALCGSSAGGNATARTMVEYTDAIGSFGIFSAPSNNLNYATDEQWDAIIAKYEAGGVYIGGGNMEWKEAHDTYTLFQQLVSKGMTGLKYDFVEGAHDFLTWHQTFHNFVKSLGWGSYTRGSDIQPASEENLDGEFGNAYKEAGYQVTFTYIEKAAEDIDHIEVWGDFQWFDQETVAKFQSMYQDGILNTETGEYQDYNTMRRSREADIKNQTYVTGYSAYQYEKGYIAAGYGSPLPGKSVEDNAYGKAGLYSTPGDAGYIYYPMEETAEGVWTLTMPIPAGQYRYAYKLFYTDGTTKQVRDPAADQDWYELETMLANTAYWSILRVGTAEEAGQGQEFLYPIADDEFKGSVVEDEIESVVTETNGGVKQKIQVYLPYNYDASRDDYKLVIVSHGNTENETVYMAFGNVPEIMDNMIQAGEVTTDVIIVTVDNGLTFQGTRFGNAQLVAQNYVEYLIPYMAENYGTSTNPEDIALCGSSAGGNATMRTLVDYTDAIGYVGIFSAPSTSLTYATDEQWDALIAKYEDGGVYIGGGKIEWKEAYETWNLYKQFVSMGMTDLEYDYVDGAHDFFTWRQTFRNFVNFIGWNDKGIKAETVTADASAADTADIAVTYVGEEELTSVRLKIESELEIADITSENDFEYNPATGAIVVYKADGTVIDSSLFTISFAIKGEADGKYPVKLSLIEATVEADDIEVNTHNGAVILDNTLAKGDINGDGSVDNRDLIMIARYLVDLVEFNEKQLEAADYNEDGKVDNKDLVLIARAIVAA